MQQDEDNDDEEAQEVEQLQEQHDLIQNNENPPAPMPDWAYASGKTWVKGFLNLSMLASNSIDLWKYFTIPEDHHNGTWKAIIVLLTVQVVLQVIGSFCVIWLAPASPTNQAEKDRMVLLNKVLMSLLYVAGSLHLITSSIGIYGPADA